MTSLTASQKQHQGNAPAHHAQLCLPPRYRRDSQRTHHTHHGAVGVPCQKRMVRRCGSAWHSSGIPGSRGLHKKHAHRFFRRSTPREERRGERPTAGRGSLKIRQGRSVPPKVTFQARGGCTTQQRKKSRPVVASSFRLRRPRPVSKKKKKIRAQHARSCCVFFQAVVLEGSERSTGAESFRGTPRKPGLGRSVEAWTLGSSARRRGAWIARTRA